MNTKLIFLLPLLVLSLILNGCGKKPGSEKSLNADLAGQWLGALDLNGPQLRLVLHVSKSDDGVLSATMDSPDQGAKGLPVTSILLNNPAFRFEMEGIAASFDGFLNREGTEISGDWNQGPNALPLVFRRATAADIQSNVPQLTYTTRTGIPSDIRGYWKATLEVQGTQLRLGLKIGQAADGQFHGTLDSLDQGASDIPISAISFDSPDVKLEWKLLSATFTGTLNPGGQTMTGDWEQRGNPLPVVFERTDEPVTAGRLTETDLSFTPASGSAALRGYWKGELAAGPANLRLVLKIGQAADGLYHGSMDSVDQGAKDIPITTIAFNSPDVTLEWKALGALFEGTVNDEGTEITGTFNQGPLQNAFLSFARIDSPALQE